MTTATAGHALHALLKAVHDSKQTSVLGGWQTVLGVEHNTVEWGRRHGEVVRLHQQVIEQITSLPEEEPARLRGLKYAPSWYAACVWTGNWQVTSSPAAHVINDVHLDALEATADHLALRLAGTSATPQADDLDRLRAEMHQWLNLINETTDLPGPVKIQVSGQMQHVLWLLDNIEMFGAAPIVREGQAAVGAVTETVFTRLGTSPWKKKWVQHYGSLLVALGLLSQGLDATALVLDKAKDTLSVVADVAQEADDLLDSFRGPKAIEAGEQKSLPSSESPTAHDR